MYFDPYKSFQWGITLFNERVVEVVCESGSVAIILHELQLIWSQAFKSVKITV